ncbi:MAG: GNAT family N-acetyltransferase [Acidobacteria bacterium]|nr:MAG: GNAT family N-acetyltransferase [Acidobacteriota bacterium]
MKLTFEPVTLDRWTDFEALFGERGACGGCWCMWWRIKRSEFERQKGEGNRQAMRALMKTGEVPGILAYSEGQPVGWCSVAPRSAYPVLGRSRILKPLDDKPVWSIVCLFVDKDYRDRGVSVKLLEAAVAYAREQGAEIVEGYPVEPKKDPMPAVFAFTGLASAFLQAGFTERARRSPTRPIMRREL